MRPKPLEGRASARPFTFVANSRRAAGQRVSLAKVGYVSGTAGGLSPISGGASITLNANQPEAVWLTVYVPEALLQALTKPR